jgi:hypothetical protein
MDCPEAVAVRQPESCFHEVYDTYSSCNRAQGLAADCVGQVDNLSLYIYVFFIRFCFILQDLVELAHSLRTTRPAVPTANASPAVG